MGCLRCDPVGGTHTGSIWNDSVEVPKLCINQIKLLGFQDGFFFRLGMFGCDVLCYRLEKGFEKPIQEDHILKLDLTQIVASPPLMDVVDYMGHSVLAAG